MMRSIPIAPAGPAGCGSCTLCCKVMRIEEIDKPRGEWCPTCDPRAGCRAYEQRPESCRAFECVWLQSQSRPGSALPAELRPDRCRVVMTVRTDGAGLLLHVDPDRPDAHRRGAVAALVERVIRRSEVVIVACGERRSMISSAGSREV